MRGWAGGLMNGSVSGVCQQICGVMYYGMLISSCPCLFFARSLLCRASATGDYCQFKLGHSVQCLHATKSAASTTTTQLNFHHHFAKQQSTTKNVWDNFYVLHKSRILERSSAYCMLPFISLKVYSCQKIRTTLRFSVTLDFYPGIRRVYMPTHTHTQMHTNTHPQPRCSFFVCYVTVSGSYFSSEC